MTSRFRHMAPQPQPWWIPRPRVQQRLDHRFGVPVTLLAAPAGYGKTSALAQVLASASAEPDGGIDLWVQCDVVDADPEVFVSAVLTSAKTGSPALTRAGPAGDRVHAPVDRLVDQLVDLLAAMAPRDVCIVLDDTHRIGAEASTWALIDELVERMPGNAHQLLAGRARPPLRLARRAAAGEVDVLGIDDLAFDDDELAARWETSTNGNLVDLPDLAELGDAARWPAMAALSAAGTTAHPTAFVIEELAAQWPPKRFAAIAALAHLDDIDDEAAAAATGAPVVAAGSSAPLTAAELLGDLPLVQRLPSSAFQLHDLYRSALTTRAVWERQGCSADVVAALCAVADEYLRRGDAITAAELFSAADHPDGARAAAIEVATWPFLTVSARAVRRCAAAVRQVIGDGALARLLDAACTATWSSAATRFEAIADEARSGGDPEVEAVALQHAANMRTILDPDTIPEWIAERSEELGNSAAARVTAVMVRFQRARAAGDPHAALEVLRAITPPTNARELVTLTFGAVDIGHPELVDAVHQPEAPTELRIDAAAGLWLRGTVTPEEALAVGGTLTGMAAEGGFAHIEASTSATFALVALAAGDTTAARQLADAASRRATSTASRPVHAFAGLADALCTLDELGEEAAADRIRALLVRHPIGRWPGRPYLFALPTVYLLAPSTRGVLDRCQFGPSLQAALGAGQALVAVRERGDAIPAIALPWERPNLLRAHVLPAHLVELAAAAAAGGNIAAEHMLDHLPRVHAHLATTAAADRHPGARWAAARVAVMPVPPSHDLRIEVLGPIRLFRGPVPVTDHDWVRRDRVRQLLALLTLHRRMQRSAVAEALWPELGADRGLHNLRVNLGHLQRVLQPDRPTGAPPWFVRGDGNWLELVHERVHVDQREFEAQLAEARACESGGRSRAALDAYRRATELVRGTFLDEWQSAMWTEIERLRVHGQVIGACCRAGELTLALGEPEEAAALAAAVLAGEPLQERAARLLVRSLEAQGDRGSARRVLADLFTRLAALRLDADPATVQLGGRLGVTAGEPPSRR